MAITNVALKELGFNPRIDYVLRRDADKVVYIHEWKSASPQPTEEEIEIGNVLWNAKEYARLRKAEYPSIEECVHAILDDDLEALQVKRAEIKARFPK
jgi:hypothetical protein|tara:strand:- start:3299 stop:3592 length:294 start_codon:yes stop_codon:yes gene_type:complete